MGAFNVALQKYREQIGTTRFDKGMSGHPEALRAEASVFYFLDAEGLRPQIHEDPAFGGVDFECQTAPPFSVEVTALTSAALAARSGVRHDVREAGNVDVPEIVAMLRSRISEKGTNRQARDYAGPRVLAIVSEHYMASVFFLAAAPELLTGQQKRAWNVGSQGLIGEPFSVTDMKNAAHIRTSKTGDIETFRPKHALILLVAFDEAGCQMVAVANPQPAQSLPADLFENIPTVRLHWPIQEDRLQSQWTHERRPLNYYFS